MSSLARRTLRTTAAAAGLAALGAGLAGPAMAAPADDDAETSTPEAATSPGAPSTTPLAELPGTAAVPDLADLPMRFVFQGPTVRTSAPSTASIQETPALPGAEQIPGAGQVPTLAAVPDEVALPDPGSATDRTEVEADPSTLAQVGALSALDSARLFDGLQQEAPADQQEPDNAELG